MGGKKKKGNSKSKRNNSAGSNKGATNHNRSGNDSVNVNKRRQSQKHKNEKSNRGNHSSNKNSVYTKSDLEFRRQIEANGYGIREMNADGNCMFRSLSDQLYCDFGLRYFSDVREEVVQYLEDHEDEFKFFVVDDDGNEDDDFSASFQDYLNRMRIDGEWAGNTG